MAIQNSPFNLANETSYQHWREQKLTRFTNDIPSLVVEIEDIENTQPEAIDRLHREVDNYNMCFYRYTKPSKEDEINKRKVHQLAAKLGLHRLDKNLCADKDKLTSITVTEHEGQHRYIPYTNNRLSWHTDGYYNTSEEQIHGILLHCEHPAASGGESMLLDHEIAYILLRDENPDYINAFYQPNAMTIPPNILIGEEIRAAQTGPIFSVDNNGKLHMRYSARMRNIEWQQDTPTLEAAAFLQSLWKQGSPYILRYTLQAHEGVICNNVLHCRTSFEDSDNPAENRLLYRGRYFDRITRENRQKAA